MTAPTDLVPLPDLTGRRPAAQHRAVIAELDRIVDGYRIAFGSEEAFAASRAHQSIAGRRAILERHRPETDRSSGPWCAHPNTGERWPCPDYRDAAAGLVGGLTGAQP